MRVAVKFRVQGKEHKVRSTRERKNSSQVNRFPRPHCSRASAVMRVTSQWTTESEMDKEIEQADSSEKAARAMRRDSQTSEISDKKIEMRGPILGLGRCWQGQSCEV